MSLGYIVCDYTIYSQSWEGWRGKWGRAANNPF